MKAFILCALLLFVVAANAGRVAMPVARSDDQDYIVKPVDTTCENGMIDNLSECKTAADQLNFHFEYDEEESDFPGGCYVMYGYSVYFNKNFDGSAHEDSNPICGQEPEPPTCDYGQYCALVDCKKTGATDLCPDQCSKCYSNSDCHEPSRPGCHDGVCVLEGKTSGCYSATADMCQDSADRGVCKNKEILDDYLDSDDDSIQDELDYFDQNDEDIARCPQCGCKNDYHILPPADSCRLGKFYRIMNAKDCRLAANRLNIDFGSEKKDWVYPEGCYVLDGTVYYNDNVERNPRTHKKSQPICGLEDCKGRQGENDECTQHRVCSPWTSTCVEEEQEGPTVDNGGFDFIPPNSAAFDPY